MDAYIYDADIYCDACGESIRERIERDGHAPADPDDETTYDSGEYPKGPYPDGGGEADCPQHCGSGADCLNAIEVDGRWVGAFLENPLTSEGMRYVKERAAEGLTECVKLWCDHYGIAPEYRGEVTASGTLHSQEFSGATVINPGAWWGKAWLVYVEDCLDPPLYIVEADDPCDAEDEFLDSEFSWSLRINDVDLPDYDEDSLRFDPKGHPVDTERLMIHGPIECRYHADGLPPAGSDPRKLDLYEFVESPGTSASE